MRVLVVGGGIAGLNCALRLLQREHHVTLVERETGPIDRVCGEGILPFGVALLQDLGLGRELAAHGRPFRGLTYCHDGRVVSGEFPVGEFGIGIERAKLDGLLRQACAEFDRFELVEGFNLRMRGRQIGGNSGHPANLAKALVGEEFGAPFDRVIGADGIRSPLASACRLALRPARRLGVRFRLKTPPPSWVRVYFHEFGELYLTPTGDSDLSVAMLLDSERLPVSGGQLEAWCVATFRNRLPEYAECAVESFRARAPIAARRLGRPRAMHLIGDALHAFDPISGAGMSFALLCGQLACDHLDRPQDYYRAIRPAMASIAAITNTILFFRGGGLRTRLMMRQLSKAPQAFSSLLAMHDSRHKLHHLGFRNAASLLKI